MSITYFKAREGTFSYETSAVTWDSSTSADQESFDGNICLKDITVTQPKQEFDKVDCLGNVAQTIGANAQTVGTATGVTAGYWQSQAMIPKSIAECKITGTMVITGDESGIDQLGLGTSTAVTDDTVAYTRYGIGTLTSGKALTQNLIGSMRLFLNNSSETTCAVATNVHVSLGDIKPTGTDGHYEIDFEAMCLAKDFAIEFKD